MRCFLLTLGTHGDVELFHLLARELAGRGHEVTLGASPFYRERVVGSPIAFLPVGKGTHQELLTLFRSLATVADMRARVRAYAERWVRPQLAQSIAEVKATLARTEYFINNLRSVWRDGERVIPGAAVTYDPVGDVENLRKYAAQLAGYERAILEIVALPKTLADPDDEWGPRFHFTGFWRGDEARDWSPPRELQAFLDAGPPPAAITMGSMTSFDPQAFVSTVDAALQIAGQRAVMVGGWSDVANEGDATSRLYCAATVPYAWLFPRCRLVIHHGGAGTVAAALRAGRASILLPQISSQAHFARLLRRQGVLVDEFDVRCWTPGVLAAAIQRGIENRSFTDAAATWAERFQDANGLEQAADRIEAHFREL